MSAPLTSRVLHRGRLVDVLDDPAVAGPGALRCETDGGLLVAEGVILARGAWPAMAAAHADGASVINHGAALIAPGFVDAHVHFPQVDVIASHGKGLMDWLETYTFPAEAAFADPAHATAMAEIFLDELLRNGATTALVFASVHADATDALFAAAHARGMRLIAGKVMMDRHAPAALCDDAGTSHRESAALIARWHGRGRLGYAVTPRFAHTSSPAQLHAAGALLRDHPGVLLQTHLSEPVDEIGAVAADYPDACDYLDVYERHGLVGPRSVFAHALHLSAAEWGRLGAAGASVAFCPTSNLFLGSGLFDLAAARRHDVAVALGTDVGAGTSFSMLATMGEAYKVTRLRGGDLSPAQAFYHATLGGARALGLADVIGTLEPGKDADFVVLDTAATPLLARRCGAARDIGDVLFALAVLGDDRAVAQTWVAGALAHAR